METIGVVESKAALEVPTNAMALKIRNIFFLVFVLIINYRKAKLVNNNFKLSI